MVRIQRKNYFDYSWKKNPKAVIIHRPSKYGNPFKLSEYSLEQCLVLYREWLEQKLKEEPDFLKPLIGKDLVCFCKISSRCHGDVLIEYIEKIYGKEPKSI